LKKTEIRICGLGGQGVVLAGQILGKAAVYHGKNAVQTQSYGAEARGSAAKSEVIISDGKIGFPIARKCDILVAMNQDAVEKNIKDLREDGILIVDSSTVQNIPQTKAKTFRIPATEVAEKEVGGRCYANIIMLGALTKISRIVNEEAMTKAISDTLPKKALDKNIEAYHKGKQLASPP
jgi:2-oxoglutarate ferredoxin oxidoreductase subunit gamma